MEKLASQIYRKDLVVFVGTGASLQFGFPTWKELLIQLNNALDEEKLDINNTDIDLLVLAEVIKQRLDKKDKNLFKETMEKIFDREIELSNHLKNIGNWGIRYTITTNYDKVLEKHLPECEVLSYKSNAEQYAQPHKNKIIKIHGSVDDFENIVLTQKDYLNYLNENNYYKHLLQTLLTSNSVIFIGYSLRDINVLNIINDVRNRYGSNKHKRFIILQIDYDKYEDVETKETIKPDYLISKEFFNNLNIEVMEEETIESFFVKQNEEVTKLGEILNDISLEDIEKLATEVREKQSFTYYEKHLDNILLNDIYLSKVLQEVNANDVSYVRFSREYMELFSSYVNSLDEPKIELLENLIKIYHEGRGALNDFHNFSSFGEPLFIYIEKFGLNQLPNEFLRELISYCTPREGAHSYAAVARFRTYLRNLSIDELKEQIKKCPAPIVYENLEKVLMTLRGELND